MAVLKSMLIPLKKINLLNAHKKEKTDLAFFIFEIIPKSS